VLAASTKGRPKYEDIPLLETRNVNQKNQINPIDPNPVEQRRSVNNNNI
jgi:hypothetical protein